MRDITPPGRRAVGVPRLPFQRNCPVYQDRGRPGMASDSAHQHGRPAGWLAGRQNHQTSWLSSAFSASPRETTRKWDLTRMSGAGTRPPLDPKSTLQKPGPAVPATGDRLSLQPEFRYLIVVQRIVTSDRKSSSPSHRESPRPAPLSGEEYKLPNPTRGEIYRDEIDAASSKTNAGETSAGPVIPVHTHRLTLELGPASRLRDGVGPERGDRRPGDDGTEGP